MAGGFSMQEIKQVSHNALNIMRRKVIEFRTTDLNSFLMPETMQDLIHHVFEWSSNDVCNIETTSPVIYAQLMNQYILEQYIAWQEWDEDEEENEYYGLSFDNVISQLISDEFFHFLDEFTIYARMSVEQTTKELNQEVNDLDYIEVNFK